MSETIDAKAELLAFMDQTLHLYKVDLPHIPADKFSGSPMGVARSPQDFTAECIGYNKFAASTMRGETYPQRSPEDRAAFIASLDTPEKALSALEASVDALKSAVNGLDEKGLCETVTAPWGAQMSKYRMALSATSHMFYHEGQVTYIQALYGDNENHWAG